MRSRLDAGLWAAPCLIYVRVVDVLAVQPHTLLVARVEATADRAENVEERTRPLLRSVQRVGAALNRAVSVRIRPRLYLKCGDESAIDEVADRAVDLENVGHDLGAESKHSATQRVLDDVVAKYKCVTVK